jgi:hypothetical protein
MAGNGAALLGLFLLSGLAAGTGVWGVIGEAGAFHPEATDSLSRAVALGRNEIAPGLAAATQNASLLDCGKTLDRFGSPAIGLDDRAVVLSGCGAVASGISATSPTQSFAYTIEAAVAAMSEDWPRFNDRLLLSYLTAPAEQWVAEWRVNMVEKFYDELDPTLLTRHEQDLRVMAASWAGLATLTTRYNRDPDFRERILAILETMPPYDQRRFIEYLRNGNG